MAKQSGLGDAYLVAGTDLSGDTNSLSKIGGGPALLDVTGINVFAHERLGGLRDGGIDWVSFFNPTGAHPVLSALPTVDVICTYCRGTTLGNPAAALVAKQLNYDPTRAADGALTATVQAQANGYGLEWGVQLTAGLRTDTAATNGTGVDLGASASFGFQAYVQVTSFSGTDATIKIQDSADNSSFTDLSGGAFTAVSAAPAAERIAVGGTATVRRYVRATTTTTGGFDSVIFNLVLVQNKTVTVF